MGTKAHLFERGTRRKARWALLLVRTSPVWLTGLALLVVSGAAPELRPPLVMALGVAVAMSAVRPHEQRPLGASRSLTAGATVAVLVGTVGALALVPPLPAGSPLLGEGTGWWAATVTGTLLVALLALRHVAARGADVGVAWLVAVAARSAGSRALLPSLAGGLALGLGVELLAGLGEAVAAAASSVPLARQLPGAWARRRLVRGWAGLAHGAGLARRDPSGKPLVPALSVELAPYGYRVAAPMLPGQVLEDWERAAPALASGWDAIRVKAREPAPGRVQLDVLLADPLVDVTGSADVVEVQAAAVPTDGGDGRSPGRPSPGGATALVPAVADTLRVTVGRRQDGRPFLVDFRKIVHWLVCGETGSGKSVWLSRIFMGLSVQRLALLGIDAKGGVEMRSWSPRLTALAADAAGAAELLERVVAVMQRRYAWLGDRGVRNVWQVPAEERPVPIVVLVDEVAALFSALDPSDKKEKALVTRCVSLLIRLAEQARAAGIHLVVGAQRPSSDLGERFTRLRAQLGGRVAHRVADEATARMALAGMRDGVVEAALAISLPGQAVVATEGGSWDYARAELVEPEEVDAVATSTAHLRVAWEELYPATRAEAVGTGARGPAERAGVLDEPLSGDGPDLELEPGEEEWAQVAQECLRDPAEARRRGVHDGLEWAHEHGGGEVELPGSAALAPYLAGFRAGLGAARATAVGEEPRAGARAAGGGRAARREGGGGGATAVAGPTAPAPADDDPLGRELFEEG